MPDGSDHDLLVRMDEKVDNLKIQVSTLSAALALHIATGEKLHQDLLQRATRNEMLAKEAKEKADGVEQRTKTLEGQSDSHATALIVAFIGLIGVLGVAVVSFILAR